MRHDSGYLHAAVNTEMLVPVVNRLIKVILKSKVQFDAIVFRGMSGALVAPIVAYKMKKEIIMVRKADDDSHSSRRMEGFTQSRRFIIIDDFIASGATLRSIFQTIANQAINHSAWAGMAYAQCVGVFCYDSGEYRFKTKDAFRVSFENCEGATIAKNVYIWNSEVKRSGSRFTHSVIEPVLPVDIQREYGILPPHENNPTDSSVVSVASLGGSVVTPSLAIQV